MSTSKQANKQANRDDQHTVEISKISPVTNRQTNTPSPSLYWQNLKDFASNKHIYRYIFYFFLSCPFYLFFSPFFFYKNNPFPNSKTFFFFTPPIVSFSLHPKPYIYFLIIFPSLSTNFHMMNSSLCSFVCV